MREVKTPGDNELTQLNLNATGEVQLNTLNMEHQTLQNKTGNNRT